MSNFASKDLTAGQLNALVKKVGGHDNVLAVLTGTLKFQLLSSISQEAVTIVAEDTPYLRFHKKAEVGSTSGTVTITQASDIFTGHIDSDYRAWGTDKLGQDTDGRDALIYEMKANGNYQTLFASINQDVRALVWQQGEIVLFCQTNRHLLRKDGYGTFFLFEVDGQLFVADVRVYGGRLKAYVGRFEDGHVWDAEYRLHVVVPQQTL